MKRRSILVTLTAITVMLGIALVAIPFVGSMSPSEVAKNNAQVKVKLSDIPEVGALEIDYRRYKALLVKKPEVIVFLIPYWQGAYRLPDRTWERAVVPCNHFIIGDDGFACNDRKLHKSWNEQARWDLQGVSHGTWMPDLQKVNFRVQGKYLVLSPEYN